MTPPDSTRTVGGGGGSSGEEDSTATDLTGGTPGTPGPTEECQMQIHLFENPGKWGNSTTTIDGEKSFTHKCQYSK